ncbi:MAG: hypothetical protein RIM72_15615 [Alphaproteobacteria bacterium]
MTDTPPNVTRENYLETLLLYHEEEIMGEAYFYALADHFSDPDEKRKIQLLAKVERHAAESVRPLLKKYGLIPRSDTELKQMSLDDANRDGTLSWDAFIQTVASDYKKYMPAFLALENAAPEEDLPALKVLTEHETISIEFAEQECLGAQCTESILKRYIKEDE